MIKVMIGGLGGDEGLMACNFPDPCCRCSCSCDEIDTFCKSASPECSAQNEAPPGGNPKPPTPPEM